MSEMINLMTSKIFLQTCISIEELCAELYHYYSRAYEDIPEASRLWKKTALEEEDHRQHFMLAVRLMNETEFKVSGNHLIKAYSIQNKLRYLLNQVSHSTPELLTAVTKAIEMEDVLADLHAHISLNFNDSNMQNLFRALSEADRDHISALKQYRTILYLPQSDMSENQ